LCAEVLNSVKTDEIAYFDHGYYVITDTIECPINIKITGEFWPAFMVMDTGNFGDVENPKVAFRVGKPGDVGAVEITDMLFETRGPTPGAIIFEWNLAGTSPGAAGMWDTHFRIGGTNGTLLQSNNCAKTPAKAHGAASNCWAAFLLMHVTKTASLIMSNNWGWVADHEMDLDDHNQIDIYNGRGLLVESNPGPVWIYGSSFEHSMLYNYNFNKAKNLFTGVIQHETA
jgi:glucan 1,3-beta-glucosidase